MVSTPVSSSILLTIARTYLGSSTYIMKLINIETKELTWSSSIRARGASVSSKSNFRSDESEISLPSLAYALARDFSAASLAYMAVYVSFASSLILAFFCFKALSAC